MIINLMIVNSVNSVNSKILIQIVFRGFSFFSKKLKPRIQKTKTSNPYKDKNNKHYVSIIIASQL